MALFFFFMLSVTLLPSIFGFSAEGADEVRHIRAVQGDNCKLMFSKTTTLKLSVVEWSRSDLDKYLLVVRGMSVLSASEDPLFRDRVELLDPQLQKDLSVVLKNVTVKDSGTYRCEAVYEDRQETSQSIHLTVTERGTTNTLPTHRLNRGLVFGLSALILVIVVLFFLFRKRFKDELIQSSESPSLEKSKDDIISRSSSPSSSSVSSTSDDSEKPLINTPPPYDTEQVKLKPPPYSRSCSPSSPPPGTPSLRVRKDLSSLSV